MKYNNGTRSSDLRIVGSFMVFASAKKKSQGMIRLLPEESQLFMMAPITSESEKADYVLHFGMMKNVYCVKSLSESTTPITESPTAKSSRTRKSTGRLDIAGEPRSSCLLTSIP